MDWIRSWAISISMVVVFGTLVEFIMPNGNYRKYIHLVLALLLIITISNPIIKMVNGDFRFDMYEFNVNEGARYADNEELEDRQKNDVIRVYTKSLENTMQRQLEENIAELKGKFRVRVEVDNEENEFGKVSRVAIIVDDSVDLSDNQAEDNIRNEIIELVSESMGISKDKVAVVI